MDIGEIQQYIKTLQSHGQLRGPNDPLTLTSLKGILGVNHGGTGNVTAPQGTFPLATSTGVYNNVQNPDFYYDINQSGGILYPGQPVTSDVSGGGFTTLGAIDATRKIIGVVFQQVAIGGTGAVLRQGVLTQADWTQATGSALLTPRTPYFLSTTAGKLTTVVPTVAGQVIQEIGWAHTTTTMFITLKNRYLL